MTGSNQQVSHNISQAVLDKEYLELCRYWSVWDESLDLALAEITQRLQHVLHVERVRIWVRNAGNSALRVLASSAGEDKEELVFDVLPKFFDTLSEDRLIDAVNLPSDRRTHELSSRRDVLPIDAALFATLRTSGKLAGVLSIEQRSGPRQWNESEKRFVVSVADLVAQRMVHELVAQQETYYRELSSFQQAIFDGANYSIISTDVDGTIRAFNRAACGMLGYGVAEVVGKKTPAIFHVPEEVQSRAQSLSQELNETIAPGFEVFVAKARRGISEEREWTYIRKDGSRFPVLLSVTALHDEQGVINGFLGIAIDISDRVLTKRALKEQSARYQLLFEGAGDCIFLLKGNEFVDCNPAALRLFNCKREQIVGQAPYRFSPEYQPDGQLSQTKAVEKITAAFAGETQYFEWQHARYDGTPFDAEVTLNVVELDGEAHLQAVVRDVSARKAAEKELQLSRKRLLMQNENLRLINELSTGLHGKLSVDQIMDETLAILLDYAHTSHISIFLLDEAETTFSLQRYHGFNEKIVAASRQFLREGSWGAVALEAGCVLESPDLSKDERMTKAVRDTFHASGIQSGYAIPLQYQERSLGCLYLCYEDVEAFARVEIDALETISKNVSLSLINARNIKELEFMAHHDSLTGLANRSLLHTEFEASLAAQHFTQASLLLLDLDRFKEINDTLGHHIGDHLLQQIGPRLNRCAAAYDAQICRLGGDEFTVLVRGVADVEEAMILARSILTSLREPFLVDELALEIDASIGVALFPEDGEDSHALLRSADVAMYEAKRKGEGVALYDRATDVHTPERLALTAELGSAVRQGQLVLHYQPKTVLATGCVEGFEALVRWQHPQLGLLYPDKFMSLAEVSDTIHALTETVVNMALQQQKQWRDQGMLYSVSVNLSARNLIDDRCVKAIERMLGEYQTEPSLLELEITETALMQDPDGAIDLLQKLSALGIKLSIDDFGTGYSSLAYLRKLPIDALKIDRVFVKDMLANEQDSIIVRSTIALAHNLGLKVIAEGVEDQATLSALAKMECDMAQGYHISRPKAWPDIALWLEQWQSA